MTRVTCSPFWTDAVKAGAPYPPPADTAPMRICNRCLNHHHRRSHYPAYYVDARMCYDCALEIMSPFRLAMLPPSPSAVGMETMCVYGHPRRRGGRGKDPDRTRNAPCRWWAGEIVAEHPDQARAVLSNLSRPQQKVYTQYFLQQMGLDEVAREMRRKPAAVKMIAMRIRKKFRDAALPEPKAPKERMQTTR